jgi:hypothetical protein
MGKAEELLSWLARGELGAMLIYDPVPEFMNRWKLVTYHYVIYGSLDELYSMAQEKAKEVLGEVSDA